MTSKISIDNRELLQKISIGEASAGIDFGNAIVRELAAFRLAAMDSKPVAYMTYKGYLLHAGDQKLAEYSEPMPLYADPRPASTPASPVAWDYEWASCITCEGPQNFNRVIEREAPPEWAVEEGQARNIIPLYRHAQPAPVVPNGLRLALSNAGIAAPESDEMLAATCEKHIQALVTWVKDRKPFQLAPVVPSFEEWLSAANRKPLGWVKDAMREAYDAFRAAMLQAGNSPVIPDGYVMVPKEPTDEMISSGIAAHYNRSQIQIHDRPAPGPMECAYVAMLAAADCSIPMISDRWIPVSERMPETDGNYWGWWSESKRQGPVWFIKSELQAQFQSHEITHWMPLPADPQEVSNEK